MNYAKKIAAWGDRHHPWILDILRIVLGLFLMNKGIVFLKDSGYLRDIILEKEAINQPPGVVSAIVFYVSYIHVLGGGLMVLGLHTRVWAILQFPVVFGAVFLVNIIRPFVFAELWLSIIVLSLLLLFIIIGSGPISLDHLLKRESSASK
ncbi:MAG TPA: DoxX family membrane protein [Puia sp.]|nr:DoxX family membrane protein [Puia sp.]